MKSYKFIFLIISAFIIVVPLWGQKVNQLNDMLNQGVLSIIELKQKEVAEKRINPNSFNGFHIFVDNFPYDFEFTDEIIQLKIPFIHTSDFTKDQLKKGIWGILLRNIVLDNDLLTIKFAIFDYRFDKKIKTVAVIHNYNFLYKFYSEEKKWKLIEFKEP